MKKKVFHKALCMLLCVTVLFTLFGFTVSAATSSSELSKYNPDDANPYGASTLEEMQSLVGTLSYAEYMAAYKDPATGNILDSYYVGADVEIPTINILDLVAGSKGEPVVKVENGEDVWSEDCKASYDYNASAWNNFDFDTDGKASVYLPASGSASWNFEVSEEQAGLYYINIEYFTCNIEFGKGYSSTSGQSSVSSIEKKFQIDYKVPFNEASVVNFNKNWVYMNSEIVENGVPTDEADDYRVEYKLNDDEGYVKIVTAIEDGLKTVTRYTISQDIVGNSMSPEMQSVPSWKSLYISDSTGYYDGYFSFYLGEGTRTFTLESVREPMIIKSITLEKVVKDDDKIPTYSEYLAALGDKSNQIATNGSIIEIQAEFPDLVSDASVTPTNNNSSVATYPITAGASLFNVIGENSYSSVGQWAAYSFRVTDSGMYNISMRYLQSALQGMFICRTVKLWSSDGRYGLPDGTPTSPFSEAYNTQFNYNKEWQSEFIGTGDGVPFAFYFEEGVDYKVYFECSLGALRTHIQTVENALKNINSAYLSILQLTGSNPDASKSYDWHHVMPEVLICFLDEAINLMKVKRELESLCGDTGSHLATLETVAILLNTIGEKEGIEIAANMSTLKSYLGTLGTWINSSKASSMNVDAFCITPMLEGGEADEDALLPVKANFFESMWFEIKSFFLSFFVDYEKMGLTSEPDENTVTIDVWFALGRDQSQIWRTMIDAHTQNGFTYNTGTAVTLKLVTGGTLLPSILARKGPDVYMGLGASDVINYAIRGAVLGVSGNEMKSGNLTKEENEVFTTHIYTYRTPDNKYVESYGTPLSQEQIDAQNLTLTYTSLTFKEHTDANFVEAAMDTLELLDVYYGVPQTMGFSMMFYRMDVLAELKQTVPETWDELLAILPTLQSNNMSIGVGYIAALDFMIYQQGGSLWKYTDDSVYDPKYAGARIDLDSDVALEAFEFVCRLYSDYSFPISFDSQNRFRTGEMPIIVGDYAGLYNTLTVAATEIAGLWEFCSLPGSVRTNPDGTKYINYDSLAGVGATVLLKGADVKPSWQFIQWQTGAEAQANYGNRMVSLIGPSAKYETANINAINDLSWTSSEKEAIMNQIDHLSSIVNYPGSYIYNRYTQFAFLDAVNDNADPIDAMTSYIDAINSEITRKRKEFADFGIWYAENADDEPEVLDQAAKSN